MKKQMLSIRILAMGEMDCEVMLLNPMSVGVTR